MRARRCPVAGGIGSGPGAASAASARRGRRRRHARPRRVQRGGRVAAAASAPRASAPATGTRGRPRRAPDAQRAEQVAHELALPAERGQRRDRDQLAVARRHAGAATARGRSRARSSTPRGPDAARAPRARAARTPDRRRARTAARPRARQRAGVPSSRGARAAGPRRVQHAQPLERRRVARVQHEHERALLRLRPPRARARARRAARAAPRPRGRAIAAAKAHSARVAERARALRLQTRADRRPRSLDRAMGTAVSSSCPRSPPHAPNPSPRGATRSIPQPACPPEDARRAARVGAVDLPVDPARARSWWRGPPRRAQFYVSQGLALALLAWVQVLPEFAVEAVIAWQQDVPLDDRQLHRRAAAAHRPRLADDLDRASRSRRRARGEPDFWPRDRARPGARRRGRRTGARRSLYFGCDHLRRARSTWWTPACCWRSTPATWRCCSASRPASTRRSRTPSSCRALILGLPLAVARGSRSLGLFLGGGAAAVTSRPRRSSPA